MDDFDTGDVVAGGGIVTGGIADGFEAAIFAGAAVLQVVSEGFARLPVEVDRPDIKKVNAAADGAIADGFEFFGRNASSMNL